jgi:hypothetical protein
MPTSAHHIVTIVTVALAGCGLAGCGTINEKLAAGVSDGDVPIAVELRRADVARNECYAALVTWATGLIAMRSW